jgi:hypothetical protein
VEMLRKCLALDWVKQLRKPKSIKPILGIVTSGLSFLFLTYYVYTNWNQLSCYQWNADYRFLSLSFVTYPLGFLLPLYAWHRMMRRLGEISDFRVNAKIYCYSCLPKRIPGGVWYIAGRVYLYKERGIAGSSHCYVPS